MSEPEHVADLVLDVAHEVRERVILGRDANPELTILVIGVALPVRIKRGVTIDPDAMGGRIRCHGDVRAAEQVPLRRRRPDHVDEIVVTLDYEVRPSFPIGHTLAGSSASDERKGGESVNGSANHYFIYDPSRGSAQAEHDLISTTP